MRPIVTKSRIASGLIVVASAMLDRVYAADSCDLSSGRQVGDQTRVEVLLEAEGDIKLDAVAEEQTVSMKVVGKLGYDQKVLALAKSSEDKTRAVRRYSEAEAILQVGDTRLEPKLSDDRRLIGIESRPAGQTLFSISGPLTRDELDLVESPGDCLAVDALLPGKSMSQGGTWKPSDETLAAIMGLDAVSASDVACKLVELTDSVAKIEFSGHIDGAVDGVATEIELQGKFHFDRRQERITWFALVSREKRSVGHVTPGLEVVARLQMKISPLDAAPELAQIAAADVAAEGQPARTYLNYTSPRGGFRFLYDRDWQIVGEDSDRVALRLLDRGELIAQCNVSALPPVNPGERTPLEQFQRDIQRSLGDSFGQFIKASENVDPQGRAVYQVVVAGKSSDLPIRWEYFLVADQEGHQIVYTFTCEESLAEQFGAAGQLLVDSLELIVADQPEKTAQAPAATSK